MRARSERGETTTQVVLLTPVVLLLVLLVVQLALWLHAANLASAAAARGASAAAVVGGTNGEGVAAASALLADAHVRDVGAPVVTRTGATVRVQVAVALPRLVPGLPRAVSRSSTEPLERYLRESDR